MKDNFTRLMLCLASLDLSPTELRGLLKELHGIELGELSAILSTINVPKATARRDSIDLPGFHPDDRTSTKNSSLGYRVERLLRVEAGMTVSQAVDELTNRLRLSDELRVVELPALSRKSLSDWVTRLARLVPEKEILRCATLVRNEHVHRPTRDWVLGGQKK
jgi:hypothetical protein